MPFRPILVLAMTAVAAVQDATPPRAVIRIEVNLVQIDAVVTDSKGRHVADLTKTDFQILQDGKPQLISGVSYVAGAPSALRPATEKISTPGALLAPPAPAVLKRSDVRRTFAMVVDDLGLSFASIAHVRDGLRKFVDQQMQPGDLVAILRTSAGMGAFQQFTADKALLHAAIDRIQFSLSSRAGALNPGGLSGLLRVGTLGALRYAVDGLSQMPGRKSVVLFSEDLPLPEFPGGEDDIPNLIDAANRSSVVLYTVDPRGLQAFFPGAETKGIPKNLGAYMRNQEDRMSRSQTGLSMLAAETGGLFIHDDNRADDAIRQAIDDSAGYYLIAYRPDDTTFASGESKFHRVRVVVQRPGLRVRSRSGFFGVTDSARSVHPVTPGEQLRQALASPFAAGDIHVRLTTLFTNTAAQGSALGALLHIDARDLRFTDLPDGSREARVDVLAMIFGDNGQVEEAASRSWSLQAAANDFAKAQAGGLLCTIHHPIRNAGAYQMRVAVRDSASGKLGSASEFIQAPDLSHGRLALSGLTLHDDGGNAAVRVFPPGDTLHYEYQIFNAHAGAARPPKIEVRTRFFRDGTEIYTSQPMPLGRADFSDAARVVAGGELQLNNHVPPGDYVFQLIVTDEPANGKAQTASQWMDFEVAR